MSHRGRHLRAFASATRGPLALAAIASIALAPGCAPLPLAGKGAPASSAGDFPRDVFARHVRVLAEPRLGGRMVGTAGNAEARRYIVGRFAAAGLTPGAGGAWLQAFRVWATRTPAKGSFLEIVGAGQLRAKIDFSPMAIGAAGGFTGPVVFVGTDPAAAAPAGVDLRGAVALLVRPETAGPRGALTRLKNLLAAAARAGAVAALVVSPPGDAGGPDPLYNVLGRAAGPLPAMRVSRRAAERLLRAAGRNGGLAEIVSGNRPVALGVSVKGRTSMGVGKGWNVIGRLAATEGDGRNVIVVGAHYDHLSVWGARARDRGFGVRPGADDNASGVAALIMVARAMAAAKRRRCTFVFIAFDGEEYGLWGSRHHVDHAADLDRVAFMMCFDHLGRMRKEEVMAIGNVWNRKIDRALRAASHADVGVRVWTVPIVNRHGWSDQAPFARRGVPTVLLHTGLTEVYHRKTDTAGRINAVGGAKAARLAFEALLSLDAAMAGPTTPEAQPSTASRTSRR